MRHWPPQARELYRVLYKDEDSECIRGLPLAKGISEPFLAELVVGCFHSSGERGRRWEQHDSAMHRRLHRSNCKCLKGVTRAAKAWPAVQPLAERTLLLVEAMREHHHEAARWAKADGRLFDPVMCLHALFRYLVKPTRYMDPDDMTDRERLGGIESYMVDYFPRILTAAGIPRWKSDLAPKTQEDRRRILEKIGRHIRRRGGNRTSDAIAYWILSTEDRLLPHRPPRPESLGPRPPQHADLIDRAIGASLFRMPPARKASPRKPPTGGQSLLQTR